jgi:hypothetical protein
MLHDLKPKCIKPGHVFPLIRQHTQSTQAEITKNLTTNTELALVHRRVFIGCAVRRKPVRGAGNADCMAFERQQALSETVTNTFRTQIHHCAAPCVLNRAHRAAKLASRRHCAGAQLPENVAEQVATVHAHQCRLFRRQHRTVGAEQSHAANRQREVRQGVDGALVRDQRERTEFGLDRRAFGRVDAPDERVRLQAMLDDLLDGAHLEAVRCAQLLQVGQSGHVPVVAHDLDAHRGGLQPGEAAEIERSFGMPGAHQHAAVA